MLKIARPVSFLLLSVALCSSGVIFAANETTTPKVGISQQQASLKGVVEDEFGPVAGASVVVKGTTNGTVTDMNGNFVLEVKKGDVIVISFIGYLTQEIKYNGEQTIKVSLKEDTQKLDEVVVIGYGINPAKRNAMVVKNEKRFLKQKRNALKNPGYSHHPVKTQASFKRLLKAV